MQPSRGASLTEACSLFWGSPPVTPHLQVPIPHVVPPSAQVGDSLRTAHEADEPITTRGHPGRSARKQRVQDAGTAGHLGPHPHLQTHRGHEQDTAPRTRGHPCLPTSRRADPYLQVGDVGRHCNLVCSRRPPPRATGRPAVGMRTAPAQRPTAVAMGIGGLEPGPPRPRTLAWWTWPRPAAGGEGSAWGRGGGGDLGEGEQWRPPGRESGIRGSGTRGYWGFPGWRVRGKGVLGELVRGR